MLQATHLTLHSWDCNWLLSKYVVGVGGLGVSCGKGNEGKRGWEGVNTTTSAAGKMKRGALAAGAKFHPPPPS